MNDIHIVQVDERDSGWELSRPRFRVYLHGSGESSTAGWTDTYDITGADVVQVIDWAQRQAADSLTYAVALVYEDQAQTSLNPGHARGLVWLVGMDGDDRPIDHHAAETQNRMLARRREPIVIPPPGPHAGRGTRPVQRWHQDALTGKSADRRRGLRAVKDLTA